MNKKHRIIVISLSISMSILTSALLTMSYIKSKNYGEKLLSILSTEYTKYVETISNAENGNKIEFLKILNNPQAVFYYKLRGGKTKSIVYAVASPDSSDLIKKTLEEFKRLEKSKIDFEKILFHMEDYQSNTKFSAIFEMSNIQNKKIFCLPNMMESFGCFMFNRKIRQVYLFLDLILNNLTNGLKPFDSNRVKVFATSYTNNKIRIHCPGILETRYNGAFVKSEEKIFEDTFCIDTNTKIYLDTTKHGENKYINLSPQFLCMCVFKDLDLEDYLSDIIVTKKKLSSHITINLEEC